MSSQNVIVDPIENVNAIENVAPDAKKQKKPTLAGKYSKLLNFGYWFSSMLESEELKTQLYNQLRLFGSIEEQTELFERFFAEEKEVAKTVRKCIAEHNKPPKPVKEKATKAPRKGKAVVHQDELISQLIADANADPIADKPDETAAKLAKEEAARLAKEAKEAEKEAAKLAKEEAARLAKEAKELKEADKAVAKVEKEAAVALAKRAKAAEKQAKEDAARLAKEAKEQEKANKAKPAKKTSKAKSVPVANEVIENATETIPIVNEVIENTTETIPIAPIIGDELVAEVIEDEPIANANPEPNVVDELVAEVIEDEPIANANPQSNVVDELVADVIEDQPITNPQSNVAYELVADVIEDEPITNPQPNVPKADNAPKVAKKSKVAKEPKATKESKATKEPKPAKEPKSKSEKKTKKADKPVEPVVEEGEEVQAYSLTIGDKEYLRDEEYNVYDLETHAHIGIYNPDTEELEYL
jgi:hypothetical protein